MIVTALEELKQPGEMNALHADVLRQPGGAAPEHA